MQEPLGLILNITYNLLLYSCNPCTKNLETGGSGIEGSNPLPQEDPVSKAKQNENVNSFISCSENQAVAIFPFLYLG